MIASCSNSRKPQNPTNIVLTHYSTRAKLESFYNFPSESALTQGPAATSISFGGKSAKSRYLCVSDEGGSASVWDMKKISRVRCFKLKNDVADAMYSRPSCIKCCMDPSDTYVVALHGISKSSVDRHMSSRRIALDLFHLKTGSRVAMLKTDEHMYGGGADCFEFSNSDDGMLLVGARDGSLLLWDLSASSLAAHTNSKSNMKNGVSSSWGPMSVLEKRHNGAVTDIAFSPMNKVLAASCSADGNVAFHDIDSKKTIQTIRPWDHPVKFPHLQSLDSADDKALTSLAFHHDGYTWATGTKTGIVFTYDLRQTGAGPLCTMDLSGGSNQPIARLQFLQAKSTNLPKSGVKKTVSLAEDGAVTVEREKTTPSRKEISKTTYSVQKEPASFNSGIGLSSSSGNKPSTSRTERIVKKTTTTSKTISSPPRRTVIGGGVGGSTTFGSSLPETKVETTSENEVTTSSSQLPSTTKRITKSKITTSSPQRSNHTEFVSPSEKKESIFDKFPSSSNGAAKRDASISFDDHKKTIPNDLTFGDGASLENEDSSESDAEHLMEDFDKMYERIKSRALAEEGPVGSSKMPEIIPESVDFTTTSSAADAKVSEEKQVLVSKVSSQTTEYITQMFSAFSFDLYSFV